MSGDCNRSFTVLLYTLQCLFVESSHLNLHKCSFVIHTSCYILREVLKPKTASESIHCIEKHGVVDMFSYGLFFFHVYLETYWQSWCQCSFYSPAQYQFLKLVAFKCYSVHLLLRYLILGASYPNNMISLIL